MQTTGAFKQDNVRPLEGGNLKNRRPVSIRADFCLSVKGSMKFQFIM